MALTVRGDLDAWRAEIWAHAAASHGLSHVRRLSLAARAVATNPLQPRHRERLDRCVGEAVADLGTTRVAALAPEQPLARIRFAVGIARAGAESEAEALLIDAVPHGDREVDVLRSEEVLALAVAAAHADRCREALRMFEELRQRGRTVENVDFLEGRCHLDVGNARRALELLERVSARAPGERWPAYHRARALLVLGRFSEAEVALAPVLEDTPGFHWGWRLRGQALERLGRLEEAAAAYGRAADLAPDRPANRFDQARVALAAGSARVALEIASALLEEASAPPAAATIAARAHRVLGEPALALAVSERATERWPLEAEAWNARGEMLEEEGQWDEAAQAFARASALDPDDLELRVDHARCRLRAGDVDVAVRDLERVLLVAPHHRWAAFFRAEAALLAGEASEAEARAVELTRRWETFYHAWHLRGRVAVARGRFEEAADSFARALALQPDKVWLSGWIDRLRSEGRSKTQG